MTYLIGALVAALGILGVVLKIQSTRLTKAQSQLLEELLTQQDQKDDETVAQAKQVLEKAIAAYEGTDETK